MRRVQARGLPVQVHASSARGKHAVAKAPRPPPAQRTAIVPRHHFFELTVGLALGHAVINKLAAARSQPAAWQKEEAQSEALVDGQRFQWRRHSCPGIVSLGPQPERQIVAPDPSESLQHKLGLEGELASAHQP